MASRITYNSQEIIQLLTSPTGGVVQDLLRRGRLVENQAKRLCPVRTGRLRSAITHELRRESGIPVVRVGTNVNYSMYVHEGTGIYGPRHAPIRPRHAKLLRFTAEDGTIVFTKQVKGQPARPFLERALQVAVIAS